MIRASADDFFRRAPRFATKYADLAGEVPWPGVDRVVYYQEAGSEVVAFLYVKFYAAKGECELAQAHVEPAYRRQALATGMVRAALDEVVTRGCDHVTGFTAYNDWSDDRTLGSYGLLRTLHRLQAGTPRYSGIRITTVPTREALEEWRTGRP